MKALVVTPNNEVEFKFVSELLNKLGIGSSPLTHDELEDIRMSKNISDINKCKKVSRAEIIKKLSVR